MSYDVHSFCDKCGRHRRRLPFGRANAFFDRGVCSRCGEHGPGHQHTATRAQVGRHFWQRGWVDRDGQRVDVPEAEAPKGHFVW